MAKQSFLGLVKISGDNWTSYESAKLAGNGKIIFADIKSEGRVGKYIYANGIEYKVADSTNLDALIERVSRLESSMGILEAWKVAVDASIVALKTKDTEIDSSIDRLDTSVNALEASVKDHETRIKALEDADIAVAGRIADVSQDVIDISTYVHTTVNASIDALHAKDIEIDGSIGDISTRLSKVAITAADNSIGVNDTSIALAGDDYVSLTATNGTVTAGIKDSALVKGTGTGSDDVSLATKGYVDEQISVLEQALVFKGEIAADASTVLTDKAVEAGYTYVATADGKYNGKTFEQGDLIIVREDAEAGQAAKIIVVERNLDGAVTASAALGSDYVILGNGDQTIKASTLSFNDLTTAIANANSALQNVTASTSTGDYVTINAVKDTSAVNVSVGVKVATLADASKGGADFKALADARDVYERLAEVEEVMSTSVTTMVDTLGMTSNLGVDWDSNSGIAAGTDYKTAIEGAYAAAHEASVTSFGGKTGAISIDTPATDGSVAFTMDGSTLKGTVVGWSGLVTNVSNNETAIGEVSTRVNEVSTRLNDLSTYVRQTVDASIDALQAKDTEIDSSIDRLDSSVSALETWKNDSSFVNTVEGEAVIAGANTTFVYVNANPSDGDVKLTSGVVLANNSYGTTTANGLATDAYVQDFLAWEVIGD